MSAPQPVSLLSLEQRVGFAGLEGSLTWAVAELRALADAGQPVQGLTSDEWSELADAADAWRASITDLLDAVARHRGGGA